MQSIQAVRVNKSQFFVNKGIGAPRALQQGVTVSGVWLIFRFCDPRQTARSCGPTPQEQGFWYGEHK